MAGRNLILTGGTGFLGSHLAKRLVAMGYSVVILKRSTSNLRRLESIRQAIHFVDIDRVPVAEVFRECPAVDTVVHAATCYGRAGERTSTILETNIFFPVRLMEAAIDAGVRKFFNTDTVLPQGVSDYALSKAHFREWGRRLSAQGKICFVNVRLEHMYGPDDDASKFTTHVVRSCISNVAELQLTSGDQRRDFIYVDDVVDAFQVLIERTDADAGSFQEYHVGTGRAVTLREFVETVKALSGSCTRLVFGALPYRTNEPMCSVADAGALIQLGWRCRTSLVEGIAKTIEGERARIASST